MLGIEPMTFQMWAIFQATGPVLLLQGQIDAAIMKHTFLLWPWVWSALMQFSKNVPAQLFIFWPRLFLWLSNLFKYGLFPSSFCILFFPYSWYIVRLQLMFLKWQMMIGKRKEEGRVCTIQKHDIRKARHLTRIDWQQFWTEKNQSPF